MTYLREGPEVMQLLVANFAMVRVVANVFQVAYDEVCDFVCFQAFIEVSQHLFDCMVQSQLPCPVQFAEMFRSVSSVRLLEFALDCGDTFRPVAPVAEYGAA